MPKKASFPAFRAVLALSAVASAFSGPARAASDLKPGAMIYAVVPPIFGTDGFKAVTRKLDDLAAQGADVLWVSPIHESDDPSLISYFITDYYKIREDFGTPDDFKALVREAHRRGMRVILDVVPNHTSSAHPHYKDTVRRGTASPYYHHYDRDSRGKATYYFDWVNQPNQNYNNPELVAEMTRAFKHWVTEYDLDGFRIDVAWGIRQRSPAFWPQLERELTAIKPDIILLAEASARDPYYFENRFDLAYDWTDELGKWAWEKVFERESEIGPRIHAALTSARTSPHQVIRFLNNNDTGKRFITRHGVARTRVAAVLQHTVPGVPMVYMGDEVGAEFEPYMDPPPISWKDRHGLQPHYRKLAALREQLPALHSGDLLAVPVRNSGAAYAFGRSASAAEQALVALNFSAASKTLELEVPARLAALVAGGSLRDALTDRAVSFDYDAKTRKLKLAMSGHGALILVARQ